MPHAQQAQVDDGNQRVVVEQRQVGHRWQRPINNPLERDATISEQTNRYFEKNKILFDKQTKTLVGDYLVSSNT